METKQANLAKAAAPIFARLISSTGYSRTSVSVADTAKLVRAALKDAFPAIKFSVRSSSYSMGASIRVGWIDGPTTEEVDRIVKPYEGADFDGSIDLKSYSSAWLSPTGVASVAHAQGTEGSRGSHPEIIGDPNHPNAVEVHFGADYIHLAHVLATYSGCQDLNPRPEYVTKTRGEHSWVELSSDPFIGHWNAWLSTLVGRVLHKRVGGAELAV